MPGRVGICLVVARWKVYIDHRRRRAAPPLIDSELIEIARETHRSNIACSRRTPYCATTDWQQVDWQSEINSPRNTSIEAK